MSLLEKAKVKRTVANTYNNGSAFNTEFSRENYGKKSAKRPRKRRTGLKVALTCIIILLVAVGICAGVAYHYGNELYQSALHVRAQANEAMDDLDDIKKYIVAGDSEKAQQAAKSLTQKAKAMNEETDGDLWVLAERIPVYGEDISTVRVLTDVFEDVSVNAIEPLCSEMSGISLKSLIGEGGTVNVEQLTKLVETMSTVAPVLHRSAESFNKCPEPHLDQLKGIIDKTSTQLNSANDLLSFAQRFAPLIPDVFGANGARNYLVIAQNNVESRPTGGFYGQVGMATVENGKISMGDFSSLNGSKLNQTYVDNKMSTWYERMSVVEFPANGMNNLSMNPDIPHVSQVFYDACDLNGTPIDGIVYVDPIFVQYLIEATGGFTASDGTWVDGSNAATVIMHDTYWTYFNDYRGQDAFFVMVANDALKHVFSSLGDVDIKKFAELVLSAAEKRHVSIWFASIDEQAAITELGFSGAISTDPTEAVTGVYFANESWSKMEWYLHATTEVTSETKNADGSTSYGVTLTLWNALTDDEAWSGNYLVVAGRKNSNYKVMYQPGDMLESVFLLAPAGGSIENMQTDADIYDEQYGDVYGNGMCRYKIHLLPGATATFSYTVTTSPEARGSLEFDMTPLAQDVQ